MCELDAPFLARLNDHHVLFTDPQAAYQQPLRPPREIPWQTRTRLEPGKKWLKSLDVKQMDKNLGGDFPDPLHDA